MNTLITRGMAIGALLLLAACNTVPIPKADLKVAISVPSNLNAGATFRPAQRGINAGEWFAFGSRPGQPGYVVDIVLSTDTAVRLGLAQYSPNYAEDVLLERGRIDPTPDLQIGDDLVLPTATMKIPGDTPKGKYFICAQIDPAGVIGEMAEDNNLDCRPIQIGDPPSPPTPVDVPGVTWGDPHLITFDQVGLEFQPQGDFDLALSSDLVWRVQTRHKHWNNNTTVSVNTAIATKINGQKAGFYLNSDPALRLGETGIPTSVPVGGLNFPDGTKITQSSPGDYLVSYPNLERLKIHLEATYINGYLYPTTARAGQMRGLLGNFDGNLTNELIKRDGTQIPMPANSTIVYGEYADSWRVLPCDSLFYDVPNLPCQPVRPGGKSASVSDAVAVITLEDLTKAQAVCQAANIKPKNLNQCILDVASTGDQSFATSAVEVQEPIINMVFPDLPILPLPLPVKDPVLVPQPPVIEPVPVVK
jgi:hypothetical protein